MTIYINEQEASKEDMMQFEQDIKAGKIKAYAQVNANGEIEFRTEG